MLQGIVWSGICRNDLVLVEAGEDFYDGMVIKLAQKLIRKRATHGWECKSHLFIEYKYPEYCS